MTIREASGQGWPATKAGETPRLSDSTDKGEAKLTRLLEAWLLCWLVDDEVVRGDAGEKGMGEGGAKETGTGEGVV